MSGVRRTGVNLGATSAVNLATEAMSERFGGANAVMTRGDRPVGRNVEPPLRNPAIAVCPGTSSAPLRAHRRCFAIWRHIQTHGGQPCLFADLSIEREKGWPALCSFLATIRERIKEFFIVLLDLPLPGFGTGCSLQLTLGLQELSLAPRLELVA